MEFTGERAIPGDPKWQHLFFEHMVRYIFASQFMEGKRVIDIGCGTGYGSAYIAKNAAEVVGIDSSKEAVEYASSHYADDSVHFKTCDATKLDFADATFDAAIAFEVIEHTIEPETLVREASRVLRRGGIFIASTPNAVTSSSMEKNPFHVREFARDEFIELLRKYFTNVEVLAQVYPGSMAVMKGGSELAITPLFSREACATAVRGDNAPFFVAVCGKDAIPDFMGLICLSKEKTLPELNLEENAKWNRLLRKAVESKDAVIIQMRKDYGAQRMELLKRYEEQERHYQAYVKELLDKYSAQERHYTAEIARLQAKIHELEKRQNTQKEDAK